MRMSDLVLHAAALGLRVERQHLPSELNGEIRSDGTILINVDRRISVQREVLAHEIGHHVHGHDQSADRHNHERAERQADTYAARLLISPMLFKRAEAIVGSHPRLLAAELEVSRHLVALWQDSYRRDRIEMARRHRATA